MRHYISKLEEMRCHRTESVRKIGGLMARILTIDESPCYGCSKL